MNNHAEVIAALRDALNTDRTLLHDTYRHLDRPPTLAGMTLIQWAICVAAVAMWWGMSQVLPFGAQTSMSIAGTAIGAPATVVFFFASAGEFNLPAIARSVLRWHTNRGVLLPNLARRPVHGYALVAEEQGAERIPPVAGPASTDLWS